MATRVASQPRIANSTLNAGKVLRRGGPEQTHFAEGASAGFAIGDLIYLNSSGQCVIATIDGSNRLNSEVAGLAEHKATGTQGTAMANGFPVIRPDTLIEMSAYHSTEASSALAVTMLGKICAVKKINGIWRVDVETAEGTLEAAAASLAKVKIVDFIDRVGDLNGRVLVQFLEFSIETDGGGLVRNLQLA